MLSERKSYPRVSLDGEASLEISGIVRSGTLLKLSPSGVQIECRKQLVERLAEFKHESGLYPDFDLEFELPTQEKGFDPERAGRHQVAKLDTEQSRQRRAAVRSSCTVSMCRRLSQNRYQLELNFVALSPDDEARVDDFINSRYGCQTAATASPQLRAL